MKKFRSKILALLVVLLVGLLINGCIPEDTVPTEPEEQIIEKEVSIMEENITLSDITIINIYDNVEFDSKFKTGFGFGCLVKLKNKTILFDTGGDSPTLLTNLETAGVKPEEIDDLAAIQLSKNIADKVEENLEYPGQIKVTVIREKRVVEYAK